ncbi:hypothetical protein KUL10_21660 [Glaciecola sp. KUL10]|nr:hypothetical protein KUL10_21660 [Glaciecola sp. KUL10]
MSEHGYQKTQGYSGNIQFEAHVRRFFFRYSFDPFTYDNHIRPQSEFYLKTTKVFRLEEGLKRPLEFCNSILIPEENRMIEESSSPKVNMSNQDEYTITGRTVNSVQNFYDADFTLFGYQKLKIDDGEVISSSELKQEIKTHKLGKLKDDEASQGASLVAFKQAKVLPALNKTLSLTTRIFKGIEKLI